MSHYDEPNMSDTTILFTVEDLINRALGPPDVNIVNFKLIQTILHLLARQQRMLEQRVEIKVTELREDRPIKKKKVEPSTSPPSTPPGRRRMPEIKEEHAKRDRSKGRKTPDMEDKADRERREKEKLERKEKEKAEKLQLKEKEKAEKLALKEREKAEKLGLKEKEKAEKMGQKEKEKAEKLGLKEKEKAEKMEQKEKERAEKEKERTEKSKLKEKEKAEKEERAAQKEKEKMEKEARKGQERAEKEERAAQKEKDKMEKEARKEQERAEKEERATQKEKEKMEKESRKEQERAEKEKRQLEKEAARSDRDKSPGKGEKKTKTASTTSIEIKEKDRGKEKVLVVEKGPTTTRPDIGRGSIEVVTQSQFALLEAAVKELTKVAAPVGLQLPDNDKLMSELAKGTATLPDTMQTLQIDARVKAAESAIHRMTGLLTELAAAGALPDDIVEQVEKVDDLVEAPKPVETKPRPSVPPRKSVVIDPKVTQSHFTRLDQRPSTITPSSAVTRSSIVSKASVSEVLTARPSAVSRLSSPSIAQMVTQADMNAALKSLKDDIAKNLQTITVKATSAAENALHTAKSVAEKLEVALKLDTRISSLYSLVEDYAEQLSGFDSGLTTQMQSFQDQMAQMRSDLRSGLVQLENVNNNAETAAVMELTERYEELATELDSTLHAHKSLTAMQTQLQDEMHSLVECVEMLREQKSDRDEVLDGLRDKADTSKLAGLLSEAEFAIARADFERRIDLCHDKFRRQDLVWTAAIRDLHNLTDKKAEIVELLSARDETQRQLQDLYERTRLLAIALGEPKAAILTRKLAKDSTCGACKMSALMNPQDPQAGAPPRLPALRPPVPTTPLDAEAPCIGDWARTEPPKSGHVCHRWCGGSHTLVSESTKRSQAPLAPIQAVPTRKFTDFGSDGRMYMFEEELQPCLECNVFPKDVDDLCDCDIGAGDSKPAD